MPPQFLFDISSLDLTRDVFDQEAIRKVNPQRGDMEHLNGVVYADPPTGRGVGYKDVRADEFWVTGHLPGKPLLPGVLMIEAAAQLASFYSRTYLGFTKFIGFSALDGVKFRQQVVPGCRMYMLLEKIDMRHRRCTCRIQGIVNGNMVFEASVTGIEL